MQGKEGKTKRRKYIKNKREEERRDGWKRGNDDSVKEEKVKERSARHDEIKQNREWKAYSRKRQTEKQNTPGKESKYTRKENMNECYEAGKMR